MSLYDLLNAFKRYSTYEDRAVIPGEIKTHHPILKHLKEYEWEYFETILNDIHDEEAFLKFVMEHKHLFFLFRNLVSRIKRELRDKNSLHPLAQPYGHRKIIEKNLP